MAETVRQLLTTDEEVLVEHLVRELTTYRADMRRLEAQTPLGKLHADNQASARNLLHYLALRRHDIRQVQEDLASLGLSSLGRAESCVLANITAVLRLLHAWLQRPYELAEKEAAPLGYYRGKELLGCRTEALLGPRPEKRGVRIMVTMPSEAAEDPDLVHEMVASGMDCMRINCAHDQPEAWSRMIVHLRQAERSLGKRCRVLMDLAGPKLRTGPIEAGPRVLKVRPQRDELGRVIAPARIWLTAAEEPAPPPAPANACIPVPRDWLVDCRPDQRLVLRDARDAKRTWKVRRVVDGGCWVETVKTTYVATGLPLRRRASPKGKKTIIGELPARERYLLLKPKDTLILTRELQPGHPARHDAAGKLLSPARIGCTLAEGFSDVRPGEPIWLDDGKIGGVIQAVMPDEIHVLITHAQEDGAKLRANKGINLPDSTLHTPSLTPKDLQDLPFLASHADLIALSFVRTAADVHGLLEQLTRLGGKPVGIVLKIETRQAFAKLPQLLLAAMRSPLVGVMIARGDLAIEVGYERLAEVQEEILWICEAAHVPVIWATQVLESLAKSGLPSRAEVTDAAMAERAECVMLNKGPHITRTVRALDNILQRMGAHQLKKRALLRPLHVADLFVDPE
jgi:pyruvate kinase